MSDVQSRTIAIVTQEQERIEQCYVAAIARGLVNPAVLVLDLADGRAKILAVALRGQEEVDERKRACKTNGMDAVLIADQPLTVACGLVSRQSEAADQLRKYDSIGKIPAAIFTGGIIAIMGGIVPV
jgi:hypothetical protein